MPVPDKKYPCQANIVFHKMKCPVNKNLDTIACHECFIYCFEIIYYFEINDFVSCNTNTPMQIFYVDKKHLKI